MDLSFFVFLGKYYFGVVFSDNVFVVVIWWSFRFEYIGDDCKLTMIGNYVMVLLDLIWWLFIYFINDGLCFYKVLWCLCCWSM